MRFMTVPLTLALLGAGAAPLAAAPASFPQAEAQVLDLSKQLIALRTVRGEGNKTAEALFGYDQREVAGEPVTTLLAPESHGAALDYLEGLIGGGVASVLNDGREVIARERQGGRIPLFMTMGRISDSEERKFCAVLRDMTAWKKAEGDLTAARQAAVGRDVRADDPVTLADCRELREIARVGDHGGAHAVGVRRIGRREEVGLAARERPDGRLRAVVVGGDDERRVQHVSGVHVGGSPCCWVEMDGFGWAAVVSRRPPWPITSRSCRSRRRTHA
mgnify:CR=1 FL=1